MSARHQPARGGGMMLDMKSSPKRVYFTPETAAKIRGAVAAEGVKQSDWLRAVWAERADGRRAAIDEQFESFTVRLDPVLEGKIERAAKRAGMTPSRWMRLAVEEYFDE